MQTEAALMGLPYRHDSKMQRGCFTLLPGQRVVLVD